MKAHIRCSNKQDIHFKLGVTGTVLWVSQNEWI